MAAVERRAQGADEPEYERPANLPEIATSGPSYVDPRGLGTFALTGLAILVFSLIGLRSGLVSRGLGYLGLLAAALLIWVYVGRLVILDPKSVGVLPFAVVLGFLVNQAWYARLGLSLLRGGGIAHRP